MNMFARPLCTECCNPTCSGCGFDFQTVDEARSHVDGIVDNSTKEGRREGEQLVRIARVAARDHRCRFYGMSGIAGTLKPSYGNQCALVTNSHSPCAMETLGKLPDEETCSLIAMLAAQVLGKKSIA